MLPTSISFAWLLWRQHGVGFVIAVGYLACVSILSALLAPYCTPDTGVGMLGMLLVPTCSAFPIYLLGVFAFGFEGADVVARESCFPVRLFRLPVPTHLLVIWPMIFGTASAFGLWAVIAAFMIRPWLPAEQIPLCWPGALAAAALAWLQALLWAPFGLRWLRVLLVMGLVTGLAITAGLSAESRLPEALLVCAYAGLTVLGWVVGFVGVRYGRRGDAPNWEAILQPLQQIARFWPRRLGKSASAAQAQDWFEWRLSGWSLTISTSLLLLVSLWPLVYDAPDLLPLERTLLVALAVPVFLAGMFGTPGGGNNFSVKGQFGLGMFSATLPMHTADMIAAMLKSAARSTLSAWTAVAIMVPTALLLTGHLGTVAEWGRQAIDQYGALRIVVLITAVLVLLLIATWRRHIDRLYYGLTGHAWAAYGIAGVFFPGSIGLGILGVWLYHRPELHETILAILPWLLGAIVACRLLLAMWALREVLRRDLLQPRTAGRWLIAWMVFASLLFGALAWAVPAEHVPMEYVAFGVLFAMPMARLAGTPLALAYNRHR